MTMNESDSMMQHINKLNAQAEQRDSVGASVTVDDQVMTLL